MKQICIITLFPEMFTALTDYGVTGRAIKNGLIELTFINPREFTTDRHQTVDDRPYGGGPGMVMKIEPLKAAIDSARKRLGEAKVVYLSPQGQLLNQAIVAQHVNTFEKVESNQNLILIAGRYEGIDERLLISEVDEEWSIGDYVLSGGELPAMVFLDSLIRLVPGALGDEASAEQDSFSEGLLDCPHYTRPEVYEGEPVPEVLMSGNHAKIAQWRHQQSLLRTWQRRPDLLENISLTEEQIKLLEAAKASQH